MFQTDTHPAQLTNVNTRIEKHGAERELAADVKLVLKVSSDALNDIEPGLRESLYRTPARGDQLSIVDKNDPAAYTVLKHPSLEPVQLKGKFPGYELTLAPLSEDGETAELFLVDVELKKLAINAHDGGSCTLTVTASANVDTGEVGQLLAFLVAEDARVTLTPPSRPVEGTGDETDADDVQDAA